MLLKNKISLLCSRKLKYNLVIYSLIRIFASVKRIYCNMRVIVPIRICLLSFFLGLCMISARAQVVETNKNHNWARFACNTVASMGVAFGGKTALKAMINEERPDHSDNKSFPSGHAAIAFAAARSIDKEFHKENIWIPIAGYAAATALGIERVASDRHHWYDVAAGAAIGYGAAELTWYLSDKLFGRSSNLSITTTGQTLDVVYIF